MLAVETTTFPETEPFVVLLNSLTTCDEAFLTDEEEPYMPKEQLELVFDHILEIRIDNESTRRILDLYEEEEETESLFESFASFFETVQGRSMNEAEQEAAQDAWNEIIEGGAE